MTSLFLFVSVSTTQPLSSFIKTRYSSLSRDELPGVSFPFRCVRGGTYVYFNQFTGDGAWRRPRRRDATEGKVSGHESSLGAHREEEGAP